jgi:alpha-tubulin suppressor-like RCC1 family protein
VQCWGDETGDQTDAPLGPFRAVAGGLFHSCGIRADGEPECWGWLNFDFGQCTPLVLIGDEYTDITAGEAFSCARKANGQASCWGLNNLGQLNAPGGVLKMLDAGANHACGITNGNTATCWGDDNRGQATVSMVATPYIHISAGNLHTCAVRDADGGVECWGAGTVYADCLTNQDCGQAAPPVGAFEQVACGGFHSCALDGAGYATCWGDDSWDQVSDTPNVPFESISAGLLHTCGVKADGQLLCWGGDSEGQVGDIP